MFRSIKEFPLNSLYFFSTGASADDDPLPMNDEHSDDGHSKNDLVSVNITNELGQTKPHLSNGFVILSIIIMSSLKINQFRPFFSDQQEDHDLTDMHHHLGHHKVCKVDEPF